MLTNAICSITIGDWSITSARRILTFANWGITTDRCSLTFARWGITTDRCSLTFARWSITSARWSITSARWSITFAKRSITTTRWMLTSTRWSITAVRWNITIGICKSTSSFCRRSSKRLRTRAEGLGTCGERLGRRLKGRVAGLCSSLFSRLRLCATQKDGLAQRRKGAKKKMRRELCFTIFVSASILHQLLQRQTTTGDRATCRYELDTKRLQVGQALCPTAPAGSLLRMLAWLGRLRR